MNFRRVSIIVWVGFVIVFGGIAVRELLNSPQHVVAASTAK